MLNKKNNGENMTKLLLSILILLMLINRSFSQFTWEDHSNGLERQNVISKIKHQPKISVGKSKIEKLKEN